MAQEGGFERGQREYYNRIASHYDRHYHSVHALRYRRELFDSLLGDVDLAGARALDAMCGGGENTAYLLGRKALAQGIDISEAQCRIYADRYPGCPVICGSMLRTGYPDDHFDIVIIESLHHLQPKVREGVAELARILKPGGRVLAWEPVAGSVLDLARKAWYRLDRTYFEKNERSLSLSDLTSDRRLTLVDARYGGNLGYFLVFSSMHFRIPPPVVDLYADALLAAERAINRVQGRFLASWVLALLLKR